VGEGAYVRFVVIKRIHTKNEGSERHVVMFQDEARIHSELHHTNIAQLYDFGEQGDSFYLVMEYVPGMDLRSVQRSLMHRHRKRIPLRISLTFIAEVLEGLAYAHSAVDTLGRPMQVVHRDVNPRNVMLSVSGDIKLIDFGVAKAADKLDTTRTNALKGKVAYMAPEQMDNKPVDGRADLFAVGLMYQEFVNGKSPFVGLNEIQIMKRVLDGNLGELNPRGHPEPELLISIRDRALATDPDGRYGKAEHFLRDIRRALEPIGGKATRSDLAAFIRQVDPVVVERIEQRLESYQAGKLPLDTLEDTTSEPLILDGSMSETIGRLEETSAAGSQTRVFAAAAGGGAVVVLLVAAIAGGAYWMTRGEPVPEPAAQELRPEATATVPVEIAPAEKEAETAPQPPRKPPPKAVELAPPEPEPLPVAVEKAEQIPEPPALEEEVIAPEPPEEQAAPVVVGPKRMLFILTSPSGMEVFVDGVSVGASPAKPKVEVGMRVVKVRQAGSGQSQTREVEVKLDGRNTVNFQF
jgi:hypothetical protein